VAPSDARCPVRRSMGRFESRAPTSRELTTDTAIETLYPMYVMHISEFLKMKTLEPRQKLRAENRIFQWDPSMTSVFFLSHQWTSFAHPDATAGQLHAMQRIMLRMWSGKLPTTSPCFADAMYLPASASITSKQWKAIVPDAYIWMECAAPRQPIERTATQAPFESRLAQLLFGASGWLVLRR
jgi:hypothetical protein